MANSAVRGPMCSEKNPFGTTGITRGSLGKNDAAAPDLNMSLRRDTPGPLGKNDFAGAQCLVKQDAMAILEVDLDETERFLFSVAFVSEMNKQASVTGWLDKEVKLGETDKIKTAAQKNASAMMDDFYEAVRLGPRSTREFLVQKQTQKDAAKISLDAKFAEASGNAGNRVEIYGGIVKTLSVVKFASTAVVKTAAVFAGPWGSVVDITMETIQTGIQEAGKADNAKAVALKMGEKGVEEGAKELLEIINEAVGDQLLSKDEEKIAKDFFKKYRGDIKQMEKKTKWLKKRLEQELANGKRGDKLVRKYRKQLSKILPAKKALANKTAGKAFAKKTVGKIVSFAFLAQELEDAWGQMVVEWNSSN